MKMIRFGIFTMVVTVMTTLSLPSFAGTLTGSLPQLEAGQSLGHTLDIPTVPNLRDMGGYRTRDGATVAHGLVYRSDTFNPMSAEEIKKLERLNLKNDYDLRTTDEVKVKPDQIPSGVQYHLLNVLADAKSAAPAQLEALLHDPQQANELRRGGNIEATFKEGYREFVSLPSAKQSYRTLFLSLADQQKLPAVFHCTTGKDRTGWAAAALLLLLDVPKEKVMEDFLASNEYTLPQFQHAIDGFVAGGGDRDIPVAIFGVKKEYLEASFDEMKKRYGTIENYFADGLGIEADEQKKLRDLFLKRR